MTLIVFMLCAPAHAASPEFADINYGGDKQQRLDMYLPSTRKQSLPVIVMVHGGAWRVGDKGNRGVTQAKALHYLSKGYAFASVNYRMSRQISPIQQAEDIALAISYLQKNAAKWGIDSKFMVMMGHSAGGHLVSLVSAKPSAFGVEPWRATISLDSAAYDIFKVMQNEDHPRLYDRVFGKDTELWRASSPLMQVHDPIRNFLLVCAEKRQDSCSQAQSFAQRLQEAHSNVVVMPIAKSHRSINRDLGKDDDYTIAIDRFLESLNTQRAGN